MFYCLDKLIFLFFVQFLLLGYLLVFLKDLPSFLFFLVLYFFAILLPFLFVLFKPHIFPLFWFSLLTLNYEQMLTNLIYSSWYFYSCLLVRYFKFSLHLSSFSLTLFLFSNNLFSFSVLEYWAALCISCSFS